MTIDYRSQTVLITGASSGIGRSFATALAARGANLVLVARRADRLDALAREVNGVALPFDLAQPVSGLIDRLRGMGITGLINNAGFGTFGPFIGDDPDHLAELIAVDVTAPMQLTSAFLPGMVAAGHGFVINVASMAAYVPTPRMAVYGAAKAFVLNFTEALWAETRGTGVTVFALSPGATSTEFNHVVGTDDATAGARARTPEDVVRTALAHLDRRDPGPSVIDGRGNAMSAAASGLLSRRATVKLMDRISDPARRSRRSRPSGVEVKNPG